MTSFWSLKTESCWGGRVEQQSLPHSAVSHLLPPSTTPSSIAARPTSSKSLWLISSIYSCRTSQPYLTGWWCPSPVTWGRFYWVDRPSTERWVTHGISLIWSHNPPPLLSDSYPEAFLSPLCSSIEKTRLDSKIGTSWQKIMLKFGHDWGNFRPFIILSRVVFFAFFCVVKLYTPHHRLSLAF